MSNWRYLCCMITFAGAFTTKQQLMHPHSFVYYGKTWMKTVLTCFTKNYCWAAIPDPIWTTNVPYESKINMLSSTDNNFMICLFDFERFSIESRCVFFTHTVYKPSHSFSHKLNSGAWADDFPLLFFAPPFLKASYTLGFDLSWSNMHRIVLVLCLFSIHVWNIQFERYPYTSTFLRPHITKWYIDCSVWKPCIRAFIMSRLRARRALALYKVVRVT